MSSKLPVNLNDLLRQRKVEANRAEADRFWNFPYTAIEEAVVNAVYHRSYEIRDPVEVRITPEDLVILSFPGLDRSIKMEDLKRGKAISLRSIATAGSGSSLRSWI